MGPQVLSAPHPLGEITFTDCFVPADAVLGEPGQGSAIFQHSMGWERACLFALYLGVQDRLIERCLEHVRGRRQFGKRLAEFQSVSNRIVEMKLRAESARLLLYRAVSMAGPGGTPPGLRGTS